MIPRSAWLWIVGLVVAVLVGGVTGARWWGMRPAAPPPATSPPAPPPAAAVPRPQEPVEAPFLRIEGTRLASTDAQGRRLLDLSAGALVVDRTRQRVVLTAVSGQLYAGAKPQLVFAAPSGVFRVATRVVELSGGVLAHTPDGRILRAARVRVDAGRRTLTASGGVTLTQPGMTIRADGLRTDAALERTTFSGHIVVQVSE